jgi:hypothetical protein
MDMSKKKKRSKTFHKAESKGNGIPSKHARPRKVAGPPMIIDGEPVRRAARIAHEKVRAQMEVMENQIKNFEEQELPAFQRWMHLNFGPEMAELREAGLAAANKEIILDRVAYYQFSWSISPVHAYAKVKNEMENPDRDTKINSPDENDDAAGFDSISNEDEEELRSIYNAASYEFEQETGNRAPDFESFKDAMGFENKQAKSSENKMGPKQSRIKTLYRRIARSLHPDCSDQFSLREQKLWHRAQDAYKAGDVAALETVLSHIEASAAGPLFALSVSDLMENTREMRTRVDYLEEDLQQARQHPAWRFTQKNQNQLGSLHKRTKKEITLSLQQVHSDLAAAEAELQQLEFAYTRMTFRKRARKARKAAASARQTTLQF